MLALLSFTLPVHGADPEPQSYVSDSGAGASAVLSIGMAQAAEKLGPTLTRSFPGVKSTFAQWDLPFVLSSENTMAKTFERKVPIIVDSVFQKGLPSSLYVMHETKIECLDPVNCM
ncbi:MAG: hypothetical protein AAB425_01775, partial [Bdellovibrionota bacterium]